MAFAYDDDAPLGTALAAAALPGDPRFILTCSRCRLARGVVPRNALFRCVVIVEVPPQNPDPRDLGQWVGVRL